MNNSADSKEFVINALNKLYDFAIKNNFKKEINKHLPRDKQLKNYWKVEFLNNFIPEIYKYPLDICLESDVFDQREKEFIQAAKGAAGSSFEILSNENDLCIYNFVNEKEYRAILINPKALNPSLNKYFMTKLIKFEDNYYIPDIVDLLEDRGEALLFVKELLSTHSEAMYKDNPKKEEEVKNLLDKIHSEFIDIFGNDEVLLDEDIASEAVDVFVDFIKCNYAEKKEEAIKILQEQPSEEAALAKESDHTLVFVLKDKGLYVAKHYNVLKNIYERKTSSWVYTEIEKDILSEYFFEERVEYSVESILKLYEKSDDKEKFLTTTRHIVYTVSEDYEFEEFPDIKNSSLLEILDSLKPEYHSEVKQFSFYTLNMTSKTADELIRLAKESIEKIAQLDEEIENYKSQIEECIEDVNEDESKKRPGRNEPCYCGSGKKYKKCCLKFDD